MDFIWEHLKTNSAEKQISGNKSIKVEVPEESKDTCWLGERISEGQIHKFKFKFVNVMLQEKGKHVPMTW